MGYTLSQNSHLLETLAKRMDFSISNSMNRASSNVDLLRNKLSLLAPRIIENHYNSLQRSQQVVEFLNPQTIFNRGYSITTINGKTSKSYQHKIKKGDRLETITKEWSITSTVEKHKKNG